MKKIIVSISLFIFSIIYSNICISIVKNYNPIMKEINKNKNKYERESISATINNDEVVPGTSGLKVNSNESFNKMNKYHRYDESLYVFNEVKPKKSINKYYDKFVVSGNKNNKMISFIYSINNNIDISSILNILDQNNIKATFFIDGKMLDNNYNLVNKLIYDGHEIELLNYDGSYDRIYFKSSLDLLRDIKKSDNLFCLSDFKNRRILKLCSSYKLNTIVPNVIINNSLLYNIKTNLKNGLIIKMPYYDGELNSSIKYILNKGYSIVKLKELLSEW